MFDNFYLLIIIIEYTVLRLVWRNHPSPLGSVQSSCLTFLNVSHPISPIIWSKNFNLGLSLLPFLPTSPSRISLSNPSCLFTREPYSFKFSSDSKFLVTSVNLHGSLVWLIEEPLPSNLDALSIKREEKFIFFKIRFKPTKADRHLF